MQDTDILRTQPDAEMNQMKIHPWKIIENEYSPEKEAEYGSLFSLANGYLGIRGSQEDLPIPEQSYSDGIRGTFINGFYDTKKIEYGEVAYGYADYAETMQNIANPLPIELRVDDELFDIRLAHQNGQIVFYERYLSMSQGTLERKIIWKTNQGKEISIKSTRFVSFVQAHSALLKYEVSCLDPTGANIVVKSYIHKETMNKSGGEDSRLPKGSTEPTLEIIEASNEGTLLFAGQKAPNSGLGVFVACAHTSSCSSNTLSVDNKVQFEKHLKMNETFQMEKYMSFIDSRRAQSDNLKEEVRRDVNRIQAIGFEELLIEHNKYLEDYWFHGKIRLSGDLQLQQGLNFSSFHLLQAAGRDGLCSVSAKGLSGEGYEGHYFWDTEMYVLPFFLYTQPSVAKSILEFRYSTLDRARQRAITMGHTRGALYPWRTISGAECSPYYPAGTAQIHINGDIALAVSRYVDATGDLDFLLDKGLEILIETAVFFLDVGYFSSEGCFELHAVTGPDEYTTMVDNNYYTNLVAQLNFLSVIRYVDKLKNKHSTHLMNLFKRLGYDVEDLLDKFQNAADTMHFPYDEELGISLQDDCFRNKKAWDFLDVDKEKYPLLLHFHPIVIYRHRVSKQADLLLAQFLDPDRFTHEDLRKSYNYYELTQTHDSSLSESPHSIMANYLHQSRKAFEYFMASTRLDLDNTHKNTGDGLHFANMAGTWMALAAGYAGMRTVGENLRFYPQIADAWDYYELRINYRGSLLAIKVEPSRVIYTLLEGQEIEFSHYDQKTKLTTEKSTVELPIPNFKKDENFEKVEAVLFDVDGVLLSTDEEHYIAWKKLADELSIPFDRVMNQRFRGVSRMDCLDILLENTNLQYSEKEKVSLANRKNDFYKEQIQNIDESALLPGVRVFLDDLKEKGIRIASGSSSKNAATILEKIGISDYFEVQVDGTHISNSKPDPEVFLKAAEQLGVDPKNCLVLEDAESGIEAATRAGMRSIAMGHIAERFIQLGARAGAWSLENVYAEDLDFL